MFRSIPPSMVRSYSVSTGIHTMLHGGEEGHFFELINGASLVKRCPSRRARPPSSAPIYYIPKTQLDGCYGIARRRHVPRAVGPQRGSDGDNNPKLQRSPNASLTASRTTTS